MAASTGMVAGSHNRNEFVTIHHDGDAPAPGKQPKAMAVCQICGDAIGVTATGDVFVACNECAFPVCRPCYEYERKEGNKCCPQCKTRYKRLKGSPRVQGDEEEEDVDDLDNEFNYKQDNGKGPEWQLGQGEDLDLSSSSRHEPHHRIPRLTSGHQISGEIPDASPDRHSIRSPTSSYVDPSVPVPVRIVDPNKDLNSYGLNSVDWKERVESWRVKQDKSMMQVANNKYPDARGGGDMEGTGSNGEDMQMVDDARLPIYEPHSSYSFKPAQPLPDSDRAAEFKVEGACAIGDTEQAVRLLCWTIPRDGKRSLSSEICYCGPPGPAQSMNNQPQLPAPVVHASVNQLWQ